MSYSIRTRDQHLANDGSPKRILALDGGGLRGILSLGLLQKVENILRERHQAGDDFRLSALLRPDRRHFDRRHHRRDAGDGLEGRGDPPALHDARRARVHTLAAATRSAAREVRRGDADLRAEEGVRRRRPRSADPS